MRRLMATDPSRAGLALAFAAAVISGISVFVNASALRAFGDPTLYTTVKNLIAAFLLVALLTLARGTRGQGWTIPRSWRERGGLIAVGVFGGGIAFLMFFEGLARATSGEAAFLHKTLVIWVAVLAVAFLRERFTLWHAAAIGILMLGQALSGTAGVPALDVGAGLILGATLLWSVEVVVAKSLLRTLSPLTVGAARMGIGILVLIAFAVASGDLARLGAVTLAGWLWVAATGLILTAYVATWYSALARARAIDVTAVLVLGAVITAVLGRGPAIVSVSPAAAGLVLIAVGVLGIAAVALRSPRAA